LHDERYELSFGARRFTPDHLTPDALVDAFQRRLGRDDLTPERGRRDLAQAARQGRRRHAHLRHDHVRVRRRPILLIARMRGDDTPLRIEQRRARGSGVRRQHVGHLVIVVGENASALERQPLGAELRVMDQRNRRLARRHGFGPQR
jgi:hypothetical protein